MHGGEQPGRVSTYGQRGVYAQVRVLTTCVSMHRYYTHTGAFTADAKWRCFFGNTPQQQG